MEIISNWNGELTRLADVRVSVLDRAFLFGDSIYEVLRIYSGRPWRLHEHIARLAVGLHKLRIVFDVKIVEQRLNETLQRSGLQEALAYIQITRGEGPRHHYYPANAVPNCLIWIEPFSDEYRCFRETGGPAITFPDIRWQRNDIKCTALVANCMAASAAHEQGCIEAIFIDGDGYISEGSRSSIFAVHNGHVIVTPTSSAVLPGITKSQLISLCQSIDVPSQEGRVNVIDIYRMDELFLTSTPEEITGIVQVDGKPIGSGVTGPITRRLQTAFTDSVESWLRA